MYTKCYVNTVILTLSALSCTRWYSKCRFSFRTSLTCYLKFILFSRNCLNINIEIKQSNNQQEVQWTITGLQLANSQPNCLLPQQTCRPFYLADEWNSWRYWHSEGCCSTYDHLEIKYHISLCVHVWATVKLSLFTNTVQLG